MGKIGPPSPSVNTLDVDEQRTYADTANETWQIIKFFLEELKPVNTEDLDAENNTCPICVEQFTTIFHRAVRLPCNHCFGEPCIKIWLSPYAPAWEPYFELQWKEQTAFGANSCPTCRRIFFPEQRSIDYLPEIESRLEIWDKAYAHVGIALSETERQAREDLWRYVNTYFARGLDEYYPEIKKLPAPYLSSPSLSWARILLHRFSLLLKDRTLTPVQEQLRQSLEEVARPAFLGGSGWGQMDRGKVFIISHDDKESVLDGGSNESDESDESDEEESDELAEGDTEEMRFFRALFR